MTLKTLSKVGSLAIIGLLLAHCSDAPENQVPDVRVVPPGTVAENAQWESVADGVIYTDGIAATSSGDVYFADVFVNKLFRIDLAGVVTTFDEDTKRTMGLAIGPDGLLYACRNHGAQIIRYNASGEEEVLLQGELSPVPGEEKNPGEFCNDLAMNSEGGIWFTDRVNERVIYLAPDRSSRVVAEGFRPNGILLSTDRQTLVVTDSIEPVLHAYKVGANGELTEIEKFFEPLKLPAPLPDGTLLDDGRPGTNGMAVDSEGRFYVSTFYGIQIFDKQGKYLGVIDSPQLNYLSNVDFGGEGYQWLYATGRGGIFRLKMQSHGIGW